MTQGCLLVGWPQGELLCDVLKVSGKVLIDLGGAVYAPHACGLRRGQAGSASVACPGSAWSWMLSTGVHSGCFRLVGGLAAVAALPWPPYRACQT